MQGSMGNETYQDGVRYGKSIQVKRLADLEAIVDGNDLVLVMQAQKVEAVAAEREACVKAVEALKNKYWSVYRRQVISKAVDAIRKRGG